MHFRSEQGESAAKDTSDRRVDGNAPAIVCEPAIQSTTILPLAFLRSSPIVTSKQAAARCSCRASLADCNAEKRAPRFARKAIPEVDRSRSRPSLIPQEALTDHGSFR